MAFKPASLVAVFALFAGSHARASTFKEVFMPENDLYKFDCLSCEGRGGISHEDYLKVIAKAEKIFTPIVTAEGGSLKIVDHWDDSTVNASATQIGDQWIVNMYGGLARRPEITVDGFTFVLCHEIGHHLGGFPFIEDYFGGGASWAAAEGQADYFAAHVCPAMWWANEDDVNLHLADKLPESVKSMCNNAWQDPAQRNLCYRATLAAKSTTDLLAALGHSKTSFEAHDPAVVGSTYTGHPAAQCRLDTYVAAATCSQPWDNAVIPGKESGAPSNSMDGEEASARHSCTASDNFSLGLRPACWFHANL